MPATLMPARRAHLRQLTLALRIKPRMAHRRNVSRIPSP
jgi:hypothetical protein